MTDNTNDFRLTIKTKDGSLVRTRKANRDFYFIRGLQPDEEIIQAMLSRESSECGVRIIRYTIDDTGLLAIVD